MDFFFPVHVDQFFQERDAESGVITEGEQDHLPLVGATVIEVSDQKLGLSLEITYERDTRVLKFSSEEERNQWYSLRLMPSLFSLPPHPSRNHSTFLALFLPPPFSCHLPPFLDGKSGSDR